MNTPAEWTVRAADYDRIYFTLRNLLNACKNKLPPGCCALLDREIADAHRTLDAQPRSAKKPEETNL